PREVFTISSTFDQSGWHLVTRSGRGFPMRFFSPSVTNIASAIDITSPSQALLRFTSLPFISVPFVSREKAEGEVGARKEKQRSVTAGRTTARQTRAGTGIISWWAWGYEISGSYGLNGRWLGLI